MNPGEIRSAGTQLNPRFKQPPWKLRLSFSRNADGPIAVLCSAEIRAYCRLRFRSPDPIPYPPTRLPAGQPPTLPYISITLYFQLTKYASLDALLESRTPMVSRAWESAMT